MSSETLLDEGEAHLRAGQYDAAMAKFELILRKEENNKRATKGTIVALRKKNEFFLSEKLIFKALDYYKHDPYFLVERGWLAFEASDFENAVTYFDETLSQDNGNEGALQGKAGALRRIQNFAAAESLLDDALVSHPQSAGLLTERAWLWNDQGNYAKAAEAFYSALKVTQPDDSIYLWQLFILRKLNRIEEAEALLDEAFEKFPDSLRLKTEHGWQLFHRRDFIAAAEHFDSVLYKDPKLVTALQGKIASLRLAGALEDAEYELARNANAVELHAGLKGEKAWTAFAKNDFIAAEQAFREIVDIHAGDHLDKINLAWALERKRDEPSLREAAQLCRESLANTRTAEALGCLGVVSFRQYKIDDAERYLKRSIAHDKHLGHHADLASLYIYMLRYDDAKRILEKGVAIKPSDIPLHLESASLNMIRKKPDKAIDSYRRAMRLDPTNLDTAKGLALALLAAGRPIEAESTLRQNVGRATEPLRSTLLIILAKVLTVRFDDTGDRDLLFQALRAIRQSRQLNPDSAESFFEEGMVHSRLGKYSDAHTAFVTSQRLDEGLIQAGANAYRVEFLKKKEKKGIQFGETKSWMVFLLILGQLVGLWVLRLRGEQLISDTMMTILVPICLGLMIVAFLMPSLSKFSVTGIAVELAAAPSSSEPKGPKGEIQAGDALPTLTSAF